VYVLPIQEIFILVVPFVELLMFTCNISISIDFEPSESESEEEVPAPVVPKV